MIGAILCGLFAGMLDALRDDWRDSERGKSIIAEWFWILGDYRFRSPANRREWKGYGKFWLTDRLWEIVQDPLHSVKALSILLLIFGVALFATEWWHSLLALLAFQAGFELTYHHLF